MIWTHRIFIFCTQDDVEVLRDIAVNTTGRNEEMYTFRQINNSIYGCNTASTEEYRVLLASGIEAAVGGGLINNNIWIARFDNTARILEVSYGVNSSGYFEWSPSSNNWNMISESF